MRKKAVSPAHRRALAQDLVKAGTCSQRVACRMLKLARSTFRYQGRPPTAKEEQLRKRLLELSAKHPRYGYRRIAALLRREGWRVGKRHIQRLRRDAGLRVPPTKRKLIRRGVSTGLPTTATHRNQVWTWDFIADATVRGGTLKLLTILDEYTRECHVLVESKYPALLGYYCLTTFGGLRPSEAERVEWADLNLERKEVFVKPLGKTGSRRFVLKDTETLWVWLNHIKAKFPNEPLNPTKNHENTQKKVRLEFGVWIQDDFATVSERIITI